MQNIIEAYKKDRHDRLDGCCGQLVVNHSGKLLGFMNSCRYVSLSSIYLSAWYTGLTNIDDSFVTNRNLFTKPLPLIDPGVGIDCYRATCFIVYQSGARFATGVLVRWRKKRFILTNFHVLGRMQDAESAWIEFRALTPALRIQLDPNTIFMKDELLDFVLVALKYNDLPKLDNIRPLELSDGPISDSPELQIVGFPAG